MGNGSSQHRFGHRHGHATPESFPKKELIAKLNEQGQDQGWTEEELAVFCHFYEAAVGNGREGFEFQYQNLRFVSSFSFVMFLCRL
jgi:hypothetical protein